MTRTALDDAKPPGAIILKRLVIVGGCSIALIAALIVGLYGVIDWDENSSNLLKAAFFLAVGTVVSVMIIWLVQGRFRETYRSPTLKEISADLLVALWGVGFAVPLLIWALDGSVNPFSAWIIPAGLAVIGILFPAIRPRRRV